MKKFCIFITLIMSVFWLCSCGFEPGPNQTTTPDDMSVQTPPENPEIKETPSPAHTPSESPDMTDTTSTSPPYMPVSMPEDGEVYSAYFDLLKEMASTYGICEDMSTGGLVSSVTVDIDCDGIDELLVYFSATKSNQRSGYLVYGYDTAAKTVRLIKDRKIEKPVYPAIYIFEGQDGKKYVSCSWGLSLERGGDYCTLENEEWVVVFSWSFRRDDDYRNPRYSYNGRSSIDEDTANKEFAKYEAKFICCLETYVGHISKNYYIHQALSELAYKAGIPYVTDDRKNYDELKVELENEIELAVKGMNNDYAWGIMRIFEEMLQYRESLEDVNEELGRFYSERYDDFGMSVYVVDTFTDGNTSYRLILFSAWYIPTSRMYIQVYDEEYFVSRQVNQYEHEGGTYKEMLYCSFIQDSNKNYLIIIDEEENYFPESIEFYLVNYEIDGKEIRNYIALKENVIEDVWSVYKAPRDYYGVASTRISYSDKVSWQGNWWEIYPYSRQSFEDNKLTIILNDEENEEISLQFKNGFWEIISAK